MFLTLLYIVEWLLRSLPKRKPAPDSLPKSSAFRKYSTSSQEPTSSSLSPNYIQTPSVFSDRAFNCLDSTGVSDPIVPGTSTDTEVDSPTEALSHVETQSRPCLTVSNRDAFVGPQEPSPNSSTQLTQPALFPQRQSYVQNANGNKSLNGRGPPSLPPDRALRSRENIPTISIERLVSWLLFCL